MSTTKTNWAPIAFLIVTGILMILVGIAVWWLESRFNETVALVAVSAVGGTALFVFGARFGRGAVQDGAKLANDAANNATYGVVDTVTGLQKASVAALNAQASTVRSDNTIRVLDARRQHQLAQEAARAALTAHKAAISEAEREAAEQPTWSGQNDDSGEVRYYE